MSFALIAAVTLASGPATSSDVGPLVRALSLVQRYGTAEATDPANDQRVKGLIFKALGKEGELTLPEVGGFMEPGPFNKLAGSDGRIGAEEIKHAVDAAIPESRSWLLPRVREHADALSASFDMIGEQHRLAGRKLVEWIAKTYRPGTPLDVIVACTGNSRRSFSGRRWATSPQPTTVCRKYAFTGVARHRPPLTAVQ